MIPAQEVVGSLYGAWRLARADSEGLKYFNDSIEGFWRSFFAAAIVLPFYAVLLVVRHATTLEHVPAMRYYAIELIAYVIAWVAFPLVMTSFARILDRDRFYVRFIVTYNWALGLIVVYVWFITRVALEIEAGKAASIVGLDFLLSILINAVAEGML